MPDSPADVSVTRLMREIEDEVSRRRRTRLVARGGPSEYSDSELFALVERALSRALERQEPQSLLLPELLGDDEQWRLQTHLRFSSHRPVLGRAVVALKRAILLPLMRWLYEYSLENFRRQERVNRALFACIEELAIENARLRVAAGLPKDRGTSG
jgi:hypothetical protein